MFNNFLSYSVYGMQYPPVCVSFPTVSVTYGHLYSENTKWELSEVHNS
jgi:hypothetical protein